MIENKNRHRVQFYLDKKMKEKWENFLDINSETFNNPTTLFRYMLSNIDLLTERNSNIISNKDIKIKELQRQIENLKLQIEYINEDTNIIKLLKEMDYKINTLIDIKNDSQNLEETKDGSLFKDNKSYFFGNKQNNL